MIIAGTGHRPDKLGGYSDAVLLCLKNLAIDYLEANRPDKVISGMALGWDTALALAALHLDIPYIAAIPFYGQEGKWPQESQDRFQNLIKQASDVVYVCDKGYAAWKMQIRNEWMVDHCDVVLALWDGSDGGTGNCIKYAVKKDKPIVNLWDKWNG